MTYDAATIAALERGELVLRDFLYVRGQTSAGAVAEFAFWTGEDNVALNVVPAGATTPVIRNFVGGGTLLNVPPIIDAIGYEVRGVSFGFDHTSHSAGGPMDMVFGHNIRVARVELHRGVFDPMTFNLVSSPSLMLSGRIDGAELDDAAAGGEGGLTLEVIPSSIFMTYVSMATEGDEQQRLREQDRFRRYGDTSGQQERWWGQQKGPTDSAMRTIARKTGMRT